MCSVFLTLQLHQVHVRQKLSAFITKTCKHILEIVDVCWKSSGVNTPEGSTNLVTLVLSVKSYGDL